jgi:hypothetical protein
LSRGRRVFANVLVLVLVLAVSAAFFFACSEAGEVSRSVSVFDSQCRGEGATLVSSSNSLLVIIDNVGPSTLLFG